MKYTLKYYVDSLFDGVPESIAAQELHDEILSNLEARYDDCINGGMSPQRAYAAVIGTMGDVSGLIAQVGGGGIPRKGAYEKKSKFSRIFSKYSYIFTDENIKTIKRAAIATLWILTVIGFILIGYETMEWEMSWLIFIFSAAITVEMNMVGNIIKISRAGESRENHIRLLKTIKRGVSAIMWLVILIVYFLVSYESDGWEITWIIFLFGAAAQVILNTVIKVQINRYK